MSDLEKVEQDWRALRYAHLQTEAMCLAAVEQNGLALRYAQHQTETICLAAVKKHGYALHYVQQQTEEICLAAVKKNWVSLQYVAPRYFKATVNSLRLRALFDPELDEFIKKIEEKMQKQK